MNKWMVAFVCFVINFLIIGDARLSPLLFVAAMERYGTNRKNASFPYVLSFLMRTLSGPFVGYAGRKYGLRATTICGSICAAIGIGGCFFAENIHVVTILWGVVYGLGFGFSTCLLPLVLHVYFKNDETLANGVALAGSSLGALVLPLLLKYLLSTYELSGAHLILSALVLNSVPAAMLLKIPTYTTDKNEISLTNESRCCTKFQEEKCPETSKECMYDSISKDNTSSDIPLKTQKSFPKGYCNHIITLNDENLKACHTENEIISLDIVHINKISTSIRNFKLKIGKKLVISNHPMDTICHLREPVLLSAYTLLPYEITTGHHKDSKFQPVLASDNVQTVASTDTGLSMTIDNFVIKETTINAISNILKSSSFRIFWDPTFIAMMVTQGVYAFVTTMIWTIILDYVRDKGIDQNVEVYFVMILPASDMAGRLGLPWVTDRGYMTRIKFSVLCFFCIGLGALLLVWSSGFVSIMFAELVFSFFAGTLTVMLPCLVNEFMDHETRTMAMSSRYMLHAPLSCLASPLIGYFRGTLGSYDGILYLSSVMCLLSGGMTLLIPYFAKIHKTGQSRDIHNGEGIVTLNAGES